jgi:hypothetical protein
MIVIDLRSDLGLQICGGQAAIAWIAWLVRLKGVSALESLRFARDKRLDMMFGIVLYGNSRQPPWSFFHPYRHDQSIRYKRQRG